MYTNFLPVKQYAISSGGVYKFERGIYNGGIFYNDGRK